MLPSDATTNAKKSAAKTQADTDSAEADTTAGTVATESAGAAGGALNGVLTIGTGLRPASENSPALTMCLAFVACAANLVVARVARCRS